MDGDDAPSDTPRLPDGGARGAWRAWLRALADDAEAALAAALTYETLGSDARETWLAALDEDAPFVPAPREALYAPLLLVEDDGPRRARIAASAGGALRRGTPRAFRGQGGDGVRVYLVVVPLWLGFVETLRCGFHDDRGFLFAAHDPLRRGDDEGGAELERVELACVVEDLSHAVLATQRASRELPAALRAFAYLFSPEPEALAGVAP